MNIIKEIKEKLFNYDDSVKKHELFDAVDLFLIDKTQKVFWIIGAPGIGKTHSLMQIYDKYKKNKKCLFVNHKNILKIKNESLIFIDALNEMNDENKESIKKTIQESNGGKYIITSWMTLNLNEIISATFEMSSSIEMEYIESYFELNFTEENKNILKTLTYRQIITLCSNVDTKIINSGVWDSMQKVSENIIRKLVIPSFKSESNKWKYFKEKYVEKNKNFPYIRGDVDVEWLPELIKYNIIQKHNNDYFINIDVFLLPITFREHINKKWEDWIPEYLKNVENEKWLAILIWYFSARQNHENLRAIDYIICNYKDKIKSSNISRYIFKLKLNYNFNIDNLIFDKLYSFLDFFPFINIKKIIDISTNKEKLCFSEGQPYPNNSSIEYSRKDFDGIKKYMIIVLMSIYSGEESNSSVEIWRMINELKFKKLDYKKIESPVLIKIPDLMLFELIDSFLKEFNINLFNSNNYQRKEINKLFWFKERTSDPKNEILEFEKKVDVFFDKKFGINKDNFYTSIDAILYITDKSTILESISTQLNKTNNIYSSDKYKCKFLKPLISYVYFYFDGTKLLNNLILNDDLKKLFESSFFIPDDVFENIKVSRPISKFLSLMFGKKVFYDDYYTSFITPHSKLPKNLFNVEIQLKIVELNIKIKEPFFLNKVSFDELYKTLLFEKNGINFYPIYFVSIFDENKYRNQFVIRYNIKTIMPFKIKGLNEQWWMDHNFPFMPFKGEWENNSSEFIIHYKNNDCKAIYTSNIELINRWYEFYADSCLINSFGSNLKYKDGERVINHKEGYQKSMSFEEYKEKFKNTTGSDEYKKYLSSEELILVENYEKHY